MASDPTPSNGSSSQIPPGAQGNPDDEYSILSTAIAELGAERVRLRGQRRILPLLAVGLFVLLSIIASAFGFAMPASLTLGGIKDWLLKLSIHPFFSITLSLGVVAIVGYLIRSMSLEVAVMSEIDLLKSKKRIAARLPSETPAVQDERSQSYFDSLVKINVENLAEYYSLVKVHTNNSFRASLLAGVIGFSFILIGVIAGFGGAETATPAKIAAIAGVITEFVSGIFFYLYNRTVRQLKDYHDSLLSVQNVLLSLKLVNDTEDVSAKRDMTAQMCKFLLAGVSFPVQPVLATEARRQGGGNRANDEQSEVPSVA